MEIWGWKTVAIFDVWTIEHILSGLSIGSLVTIRNSKVFKEKLGIDAKQINTNYFDLIGVLFLAFAWETLEHYLEIGLAGEVVQYWFQGVEFWANRLISDPLMLVLGYYIVKHYTWMVTPARILSLIWLIVHIFVFPHSMYLHEIF
ncbi:MAG: hypothetical protein AAF502_20675 [Bacteroidota bacterium]